MTATDRASAVDQVDLLLERLDANDDPAIWIDRVDAAALRAAARELDAIPPSKRGPLHAVPFAVKDNIDIAGRVTTAGLPGAAYVAGRTATFVARLTDAGALLVGKTNLDQLATGLVGTRSPYGTPRNPLAPDRIPGGSSSGSGVAVALGLVDFAVGTDTAGSGRVPAACTGVVGLKPAPGGVAVDGVFPASPTADCISVFARSVRGAATAFEAGAGRAWGRASGPFTVGVPGVRWRASLEPAVADVLAADERALLGAGHAVVAVDMAPFFAAGDLLYEGPWLAERTATLGELVDRHDGVVPVVREVIGLGRRWSGVEVFAAMHRLVELRAVTAPTWADVDALVVPSIPFLPTLADVDADPIGVNARLGRFTTFVNLLGLAAITVPSAPRPDGLPGSVTVIGPTGREPVLRAIAEGYAGEHPTGTRAEPGSVEVAVVGAHLRGQPLNHQLTDRGAVLVARTTTAPTYLLHHLAGGPPERPGLERVGARGRAIEVEIWRLDVPTLGALTAEVAPPLGIGSLELADGRWVKGFICETHGLAGARDITAHGSWRAYLATR